MNTTAFRIGVGSLLLIVPLVLVLSWVGSAESRLREATIAAQQTPSRVAVAAVANERYCTPQLKQILRRVLQSCGLLGRAGRGCQPLQARNVATMSGTDFNALFLPMAERAGIIQFDKDSFALDSGDQALIDRVFADRRGASYFFVVARASPEGEILHNRDLSRRRAEAVLGYLHQTFHDPELEQQVGLLWLGAEYAQLEQTVCGWRRSGPAESCTADDLNRSAFVAWIDCSL